MKTLSALLHRLFLISFLSFSTILSLAQNTDKGHAYVDKNGVLRWKKTKGEVKGFGVNYSVPFAHAYRSAKKMGIYPKQAIDNDVYHFSRLGFDLYRLHVWDTEISDSLGNLIENENLETFDYLLWKLRQHGIRQVITPIAFWGNGWPEPDENTPGFSHKYGKGKCLTDPDCIKAQQNYLYQFLNHVNPYTGIAYKDDPFIIAFEVSNEPHHWGGGEKVAEFVKGMVNSMKRTGTKKPIFYNTSHGVHFTQNYFDGGIQGGTFQWYPTGLGYYRELSGNLLPNVNDYEIPFDPTFKKNKGAKLVYEFDAADVGRSYIYPAMARSFREAGIQIATHFAYDPTYLAYANTEYNTHYMNLNYTPQKAISLMICKEVFHNVPMYSNSGVYPENNKFGDFLVSYENDLSQYNSAEKFYYTNSTKANPKNISQLQRLAGYGNSAIVKYDGQGAYFLDKIGDGLWRLEVMPDAVWVQNPFGRNSLDKTVGVINWAEHQMTVSLPGLGEGFKLTAINKGNNFSEEVEGRSFKVMPGTYMLAAKGSTKKWSPNDDFGTNKLGDFYAPPSNVEKSWLKHEPLKEVTAGKPIEIKVQYIAPEAPAEIQLMSFSGWKAETKAMTDNGDYTYSGTIEAEKVKEGYLNYYILVKKKDGSTVTYPAGKEGYIWDWDFYERDTYSVKAVASDKPVHLFNASEDVDKLVRPWRNNAFSTVPTQNFGEMEYRVNLEKLFVPDNENLKAAPIYDYSFKHFVLDKIAGRKADLANKKELVFTGRSLNGKPCKFQIAFVLNDGASYGTVLELQPERKEYRVKLSDLKAVKTVTLPRPYPSFLPYYLEHQLPEKFDISRIESLQFSIGPGISEEELESQHGVGMVNVRLE